MFSSFFSRCTQTDWVLQQQALRRGVAEAPAGDLPKLLISGSQGYGDGTALWTARMDQTTGATIWHIVIERPDQMEALRQLHDTYVNSVAPSSVRSKSRGLAFTLPDKQGRTPLFIACHQAKLDAVSALLEWGSNPMLEKDKKGRLPIHVAAQSGGQAVVKVLLQWACDNDPTESRGQQPVEMPQQQQQQQLQLQPGDQPHDVQEPAMQQSPSEHLDTPVQAEQEQQVQGAVHPETEISPASQLCRSMVSRADHFGLTPLHYAAAANDVASCQLLLNAGASVTATSTQASYDNTMPCNAGMTPLHVAAMNNSFQSAHVMLMSWSHLSVSERVLQFPVDVRSVEGTSGFTMDPRAIMDKEGKTACMVASSRRFDALTDLLDPTHPMPGAPRPSASGAEGRAPPPLTLCCPITMDLMEDPVVIGDGFSYERAAIEKWLMSNSTSPLTNTPLANKGVFPNRVLRQAIEEWRQANKLPPLARLQDPKSPVRSRGHAGPVLQGGMGDGFIRQMADGGAANGRRR